MAPGDTEDASPSVARSGVIAPDPDSNGNLTLKLSDQMKDQGQLFKREICKLPWCRSLYLLQGKTWIWPPLQENMNPYVHKVPLNPWLCWQNLYPMSTHDWAFYRLRSPAFVRFMTENFAFRFLRSVSLPAVLMWKPEVATASVGESVD